MESYRIVVRSQISQLAKFGLPAGRGRKSGIAKRKQSRTVTPSSAVVTQRPATVCRNDPQKIDQQSVAYLTAVRPNQNFQQCAVEDHQARAQMVTSQPVMVQQQELLYRPTVLLVLIILCS